MPYAEGGIYNDADSHIMETWIGWSSYADPKVRDRTRPRWTGRWSAARPPKS